MREKRGASGIAIAALGIALVAYLFGALLGSRTSSIHGIRIERIERALELEEVEGPGLVPDWEDYRERMGVPRREESDAEAQDER